MSENDWVPWEPIPGLVFPNTHLPSDCEGRHCIVHNPKHTHMDDWPLHWRSDRGLYFERICPHGVGHPDPSQFDYWNLQGRVYETVHGCDLTPEGKPCCGQEGRW